jgi:hypothetical protein
MVVMSSKASRASALSIAGLPSSSTMSPPACWM